VDLRLCFSLARPFPQPESHQTRSFAHQLPRLLICSSRSAFLLQRHARYRSRFRTIVSTSASSFVWCRDRRQLQQKGTAIHDIFWATSREHYIHGIRGHHQLLPLPSNLVTASYPLWPRWLRLLLGCGFFQVGTSVPYITISNIVSTFPPKSNCFNDSIVAPCPSFYQACADVSILHTEMDLIRVCVVGGNAVSAFLSWRLQATNACDVTLVWKSGFDAVHQYGISFKYILDWQIWILAEC
jgi:hypothetical protein